MPTVITRRNHKSFRSSDESLVKRYGDSGRCITDRFVACKVGGMLLLKLAGFVEDERAEVLNISASHVTLRLGRPWYQRVGGGERRRPIECRIQFAEPGEDMANLRTASARRSLVEVRLRPLSTTMRTRDFHERADSILRMLRLHFVAD